MPSWKASGEKRRKSRLRSSRPYRRTRELTDDLGTGIVGGGHVDGRNNFSHLEEPSAAEPESSLAKAQRREGKKHFPNFAPWRLGERKSESETVSKNCTSRANLQP